MDDNTFEILGYSILFLFIYFMFRLVVQYEMIGKGKKKE